MAQSSYPYANVAQKTPILGTKRDSSQGTTDGYLDIIHLRSRKTNKESNTPLYPKSDTPKEDTTQPGYPVYIKRNNGNKRSRSSRTEFIGTLNGEGAQALKKTNNNKELARIVVRNELELYGMPFHEITPEEKNGVTPYPIGQLGVFTVAVNDPDLEVGDWVIAEIPHPDRSQNDVNLFCHAENAVVADLKKYKPESLGDFYTKDIITLLKGDTLKLLDVLFDPKTEIGNAKRIALSNELQATLKGWLFGMNFAMQKGLVTVVDTRTEFNDENGDMLSPNEITATLYQALGLSKVKDPKIEDRLNSDTRIKSFYKLFLVELLSYLYFDGKNGVYEYGRTFKDNGEFDSSKPSLSRDSEGKIKSDIHGEMLFSQLNYKAQQAASLSAMLHDNQRLVLGKMTKVDHKSRIGTITVVPHL